MEKHNTKLKGLQKKTKKERAEINKKNYEQWKKQGLDEYGFFIIFNGFVTSNKLKEISGNALKLYIYMLNYADTNTGEVWHSSKTIAKYFNKTDRTIRNWIKELEEMHLIERFQLKYNGEAHNYIQTYNRGEKRTTKTKKDL